MFALLTLEKQLKLLQQKQFNIETKVLQDAWQAMQHVVRDHVDEIHKTVFIVVNKIKLFYEQK